MAKYPFAFVAVVALIQSVHGLATLPEHLSHGAVGRSFTTTNERASSHPGAKYLTVPLDHFAPAGGPTWRLKYFVVDDAFQPGGAVLLTMPSEGATNGCYSGTLAIALHAACVCAQHRYFGDSVPNNDSSTDAFIQYLSVEQNLADQAALIKHMRTVLYPSAAKTVVHGGSYAGASSAWMRHVHPSLVDAAIAQSPPVTAMYDFSAYDTSNLIALSSPDSRCAHTQAKVAAALTRLLTSSPSQLMKLFGAEHYETAPMGMVDFMYALGDSAASAVQYGSKHILCDALKPIYTAEENDKGDWHLAGVYANYTSQAWGPSYFKGCFYNSSCMASATKGHIAEAARSWYWMKCAHLGYLQTAPKQGSLSTRPMQLTVEKLMSQCEYIYGKTAPLITPARLAAFNAKVGGGTVGGISHVFEIDYSDDPWKMATTSAAVQRQAWPLSLDQPFMLLTCDGCGHCGAGVDPKKGESIDEQTLSYLASWGIGKQQQQQQQQQQQRQQRQAAMKQVVEGEVDAALASSPYNNDDEYVHEALKALEARDARPTEEEEVVEVMKGGKNNCTGATKQKALYLEYDFGSPTLREAPALDISVVHTWNSTSDLKRWGKNGVFAAQPIGTGDGVGGYFGSQVHGQKGSTGSLLFSIWDEEVKHTPVENVTRCMRQGGPNATWCTHKHAFALSQNCYRHCLDCGLHKGWHNTTGVQCHVELPLKEGEPLHLRLRRTSASTTFSDPRQGLGLTYHGSEWELLANGVVVVGKMFWERTYKGLTRFGAFHEHIGCTPCDAFYESEIRTGPWVHAPLPERPVSSIAFSRKNVSCQLYDVAVHNHEGETGAVPWAQIFTGPGTGPTLGAK